MLVPGTEYFFFMFFHRHAAWLLMNMRCKQVYVIDFFFFFLPVLHCSHHSFDKGKNISALPAVYFKVISGNRVFHFKGVTNDFF